MSIRKALRFARRLVGLLCLLLTAVMVVRAERLPTKTYTIADGLAQDNVLRKPRLLCVH